MNRLNEQIEIINEFYKKMQEYIDKQVEIKVNEILKKNNIVQQEEILFTELYDELFPKYKENEQSLKKDIQPNKWEEVRGEKVFKRLEEMGLSHKDMMKFKKAKIPMYIIAKMLNLGFKTVSGYYKNYAEGKK
jgi:coenzyme F420-reducing hydrogenase alpha subunit